MLYLSFQTHQTLNNMKKPLIALIIIIVLIFSYNKYQDYKRFNGPQTNYEAKKNIDINYHNKTTVFNYQNAIYSLNGFVSAQWSMHGIDVLSPEKDTKQTQLAINTYAKKLAKVKHYESILAQSILLKEKGLNNKDIQLFEETGLTVEEFQEQQKKKKHIQTIRDSFAKKNIKIGQKSPLVFEIQKLLINNGYSVENDGVFKTETSEALKIFETKQNLLPDGKLDLISLEYLLGSN